MMMMLFLLLVILCRLDCCDSFRRTPLLRTRNAAAAAASGFSSATPPPTMCALRPPPSSGVVGVGRVPSLSWRSTVRGILRLQRNSKKKTKPFSTLFTKQKDGIDNDDACITPAETLMLLSLSHLTSQALYTFVELGVADHLARSTLPQSARTIAAAIAAGTTSTTNQPNHPIDHQPKCNADVLERILRLLATQNVVQEHWHSCDSDDESSTTIATTTKDDDSIPSVLFSLTPVGALLARRNTSHVRQHEPSLSLPHRSMVQHWMEEPMWQAWSQLSNYTKTTTTTLSNNDNSNMFQNANNGMSLKAWYSSNPSSLLYANDFLKMIAEEEIKTCVENFDWNLLNGKPVLDLGGYNGAMMKAVKASYPQIRCICLDLPEVIVAASSPAAAEEVCGVEFIAGDMFDLCSPACDAIFMKHIVYCDWDDVRSNQILRSCHNVLPDGGLVIIAEAVLPDPPGGWGQEDRASGRHRDRRRKNSASIQI
jgi:O-methyltransferase domain